MDLQKIHDQGVQNFILGRWNIYRYIYCGWPAGGSFEPLAPTGAAHALNFIRVSFFGLNKNDFQTEPYP